MSREQAMVIEDKARYRGFTTYHEDYVPSFHGRGDTFVVISDRDGNLLVAFDDIREALDWLHGLPEPIHD